jgi:hypothetical protein
MGWIDHYTKAFFIAEELGEATRAGQAVLPLSRAAATAGGRLGIRQMPPFDRAGLE